MFAHWHGVAGFVRAVIDRLHEAPDLVLLLVGDGRELPAVREEVRARGLQDRILLPGRVPHAQVPEWLACMDYGVLPDSNEYGSPMKLFEQMALGVAVVAPDYDPVAEVIRDGVTGWLFPRGDLAACVDRVLALADRDQERRRVGAAAQAYITAERQWRNNALQLLSLLPEGGKPGEADPAADTAGARAARPAPPGLARHPGAQHADLVGRLHRPQAPAGGRRAHPRHVLLRRPLRADARQGRPGDPARPCRPLDEGLARAAGRHRDADGRPPQHGFFYPEEEYLPEHLDKLSALCRDGFGEIEVHLHHDDDTEANFRRTIAGFCEVLHRDHGALPRHPQTGQLMFGFIHGNWCLDNSNPDGRWCGLNNELILLREAGCYADFTMPSAPSPTQTRIINSIYYATDDPDRPKSHDAGVPVRVGGEPTGDLLLVQGPIGLNWTDRRRGIVPRVENADIRANYPPTPARVDGWIRTGIHVEGRPEWVFVKIHTHGAPEKDAAVVLGPTVDAMFEHLERQYNDGERYVLHYVNAREVYNIVKAAEAGMTGNPADYRDFVLPPPAASWAGARSGTGPVP